MSSGSDTTLPKATLDALLKLGFKDKECFRRTRKGRQIATDKCPQFFVLVPFLPINPSYNVEKRT